MSCPDIPTVIDGELSKVLTQYRESPKLLHLIRTALQQVGDITASLCSLPEMFDIETAVGDQLTLVGKRLGFGRTHCVCTLPSLFGFDCDPNQSPQQMISGFCDDNATWINCGPFGTSDITLGDDDLYRRFIMVRRYQMLALYDLQSLTDAVRALWGANAQVLYSGNRKVVVAPGRELTQAETAVLQLYPRVLPIAPGITVRFHFNPDVKVFGFGEGWGGFCESLSEDGLPFATQDGTVLVTEDGTQLITGPLKGGAPWLCQTDVSPYECAA